MRRTSATPSGTVFLLERHPEINVRLLADLFHMNIEETSIAAGLRDGGRWIGHVHFVDSNRRPAGLGHMDYGPVAAALGEIDTTGMRRRKRSPIPIPTRRPGRRSRRSAASSGKDRTKNKRTVRRGTDRAVLRFQAGTRLQTPADSRLGRGLREEP